MKALTVFSLTVLLVAGCREKPMEKAPEAPAKDVQAHRAEIAQWQEKRATRLKAEDGWLSLIGLFWLNEGNNVISIPSAGSPTVKLARHGGAVTLEPGAGNGHRRQAGQRSHDAEERRRRKPGRPWSRWARCASRSSSAAKSTACG
jgi:hypothetical protein